MSERFKVNLRGIIELLSNHLYGSPDVFLRELLQNSADALVARGLVTPGHKGRIGIEWVPRADGPPALQFRDDGVGLSEDEIHRFLATIGESSKRGDVFAASKDFIGRFGIGLLSCFMVSDEVQVITRSARDGAATFEWRGRQDGTYSVKPAAAPLLEPGTQVTLVLKAESAAMFPKEVIAERLAHFGGLLTPPVTFTADSETTTINGEPPPWRRKFESAAERREAMLAYGEQIFEQRFVDAIPLHVDAAGLDGVAFVLAESPHYAAKQQHRVYLKNMLVSERADNLLPDWAFFVRCVVNATNLEPTASREGFYENEALESAREGLGNALREYLMDLARTAPNVLLRLMGLHGLAMKALALDDDEFLRLVGDWFPFETSMGLMTLGELRGGDGGVLRYVPSVDDFRQMSRVGQAQGLTLINAGYTYDAELLERAAQVFEGVKAARFMPGDLSQRFEPVSDRDHAAYQTVLTVAREAIGRFDCQVELLHFQPVDIPALFVASSDELFRRDAERTQEVSDELYGGLVAGALERPDLDPQKPRVTFNASNAFIKKLTRVTDRAILRRSLEMLYVQSLLLGHRPLRQKEMALLNRGLMALIEAQLQNEGSVH